MQSYGSYAEKERYVLERLEWLMKLEANLLKLRTEADAETVRAAEREAAAIEHIGDMRGELDRIVSEKRKGFPWLAEAIADYFDLKAGRLADRLASKKHPARTSADVVRLEAQKRRLAEKQFRTAKYLLTYYESLFPWLEDLRDEAADELIKQVDVVPLEGEHDPAHGWLSDAEYCRLSAVEREQLALDRWMSSRKTKWQIGRDYERYVGYLREADGYSVHYHGIVEGFADLGKPGDATHVSESQGQPPFSDDSTRRAAALDRRSLVSEPSPC